MEPRWGWVGTWARMVNAEGLRRFLVTDASRGGWSDKADKIKTGPVRWNETSSDPQEGVSSGHFAGKQTGPSAAKPTVNRKLFPSPMEKAPAPPMTRQAGTFPPTDPCGREEDSQKMGQTLVNAVISEWFQVK